VLAQADLGASFSIFDFFWLLKASVKGRRIFLIKEKKRTDANNT
jgi:hypothetical protein